jgi:hypothetical protein
MTGAVTKNAQITAGRWADCTLAELHPACITSFMLSIEGGGNSLASRAYRRFLHVVGVGSGDGKARDRHLPGRLEGQAGAGPLGVSGAGGAAPGCGSARA